MACTIGGTAAENSGGAHLVLGMGNPLASYVITVADHDAPGALEVIKSELEAPAPSEHPDRYIPPVAMIHWPCDCGQTLEVTPDFEGLEMDCPFCGRLVTARTSP